MRLDVRKYLFVGHHAALAAFFEKAQEAGLVHFIDTAKAKMKEAPASIQQVIQAIKIIREFPVLNQEEPENEGDVDSIAERILDLKHSKDTLEERKRILKLEIARVDVFGQFSMQDLKVIEKEGNRQIRFFFSKKGMKEDGVLSPDLIYIGTKFDLDYFISITKDPVQYEYAIEIKIDRDLGSLVEELTTVGNQLKEIETELKYLSKYNQFLHRSLTRKYNTYNRETAQGFAQTQIQGQLFAIEGWVSKDKLPALEEKLHGLHVFISEIAIEEGDVVPTCLENHGLARIGEDLVHIYDTPSNTDKDPSLWVLFSFAIFFAMIINDGGYGLLFLIAALYAKYKQPRMKAAGIRAWKLAAILCGFCVLWGVLTNSYFSFSMAPDHSLRKVSLLNYLTEKKAAYIFETKDGSYMNWVAKYPHLEKAQNSREFLTGAVKQTGSQASYEMVNELSDSILLELALLVGIVHICLSFLRYLDRNWQGIGWVLAIIGCYLYFPEFLNANTLVQYVFGISRQEAAAQGYYLLWFGYGLAILIGVIRNKLLGLLEIMNAIQIFSDIISYVRIYALGLAGAIIGATINDIAGSLIFLGGGVLFILGHGLNMLLSIVGGIIHGLRLNFIEWYHYSFEGGGKLFDPLRKLEVE